MIDTALGLPNYFTTAYFWVTTGITVVVAGFGAFWKWKIYK